MSTFDIIQAAVIFGSGVIFAGPMGALLTYVFLQEKVQREEMLRHLRQKHERTTLNSLAIAANTPIPFVTPEKIPVPRQPPVQVVRYSPATPSAPSPALPSLPTPVKVDFTRVDHLPAVRDRRHTLPTRSPLVTVTMSLKPVSGGWAVTGRQGVTETDLISLRAIQEMQLQEQ